MGPPPNPAAPIRTRTNAMPTAHAVLSLENPTDSTRPRRRPRDVVAVYQLLTKLTTIGYEHGDPIINAPRDPLAKDDGQLLAIDLSFLRPGDLLLWAGRPEKDNYANFPRKRIYRAWTD